MSSDEEQEWFSDGLTEELLNALARTPDLLVAARTSSFKFKGSNEDAPTIAKALGVAHILEGSVRRDRDRLRVTAQLIRASDGFHIWSQNYDRKPEDVITLQEEVAIAIATALQTAMDPDALASMVSAGTNSVPAYNEYLKGLAYGISTATTSDPYEFLSAKDAFVRAIELDPEFALAYWELAIFWRVQLGTTNIVSGTLDLSNDEMRTRFDDAIAKAIEFEQDPVNKLRYRILRSMEYLQYAQALRMNIDYLEQRPNDQGAQLGHLNLLADMSRDDELRAAIEEFQERDGYDIFVVNSSMTLSLISDDKPFIRMFAQEGMRRLGDSMYVIYQAHRSLLWAGDIDGASQLVPIMRSSDLPRESVGLIELRQACAENKPNDAARVYDRVQTDFPDDISIIWISHKIMNQHDAALESLIHLDNPEGLDSLADFLSYAYFDARQFPILMAHLESQGIDPREPREIPYRCKL
jgi:TolB-like protein